MQAVSWCFLWMLLQIVLSSGQAYRDGVDLSWSQICCEVGRQMAENTAECNEEAMLLPEQIDISPEECGNYWKQCCRRNLRGKLCEIGRITALGNKPCENLTSFESEDCCLVCKTGLSAMRCDPAWLGNDVLLQKTFKDCCEHKNRRDVAPRVPRKPRCELFPGFPCPPSPDIPKLPQKKNCVMGFNFSDHVGDCIDIDECAAKRDTCREGQVCVNRYGSFTCKEKSDSACDIGYEFKEGVGCVDENDCASPHLCSHLEVCVNRGGEYICVRPCKKGFQIDPVSVECVDIDECAANAHDCQKTQACVNLEGGFTCIARCEEGFRLNSEGQCEDIDECASWPCDGNFGICRNTIGSFVCECKPGFERIGEEYACEDIDECKRVRKPCGERASCVNTIGSFSCFADCGDGYHHVNGSCIDKNECKTLDTPCLNGQQCVNLPGTYKCIDKDCEMLGKVLGPDGTCLIRRTCLVGSRYDPYMDVCVDINECAVSYPSACPPNTLCVNTVGSFICNPVLVECSEGMRRSLDGTRCENIDECAEDLHNCDLETEVCLDRTGSFDCVCKEGFKKDGSGRCVSISLDCGPGFRLSSDGLICQDVNECDNPGVCEHECENTIGSYECKCRAGFEPDKRNTAKCVDIDECKRPGVCPGLCENTHGSYKCRCPEGYEMKRNSCLDIDECSDPSKHNCLASETCLNIGGGFRCLSYECPSNYTKARANTMRCFRNQPCEGRAHCSLDPDLIIFNHIPLSRSNWKRPLSVRISGKHDVSVDFSLHISKVVSHKIGLVEATDENFQLKTRSRSAKIHVPKKIPGPQDVHMTLKAKIYNTRNGTPVGTELNKIVEWRIVFYVPAYDF